MTRPIQFGIDRLLADPALRRPLAGRRVALLAHPASVTADLTHALDALAALPDLELTVAFGPQHGLPAWQDSECFMAAGKEGSEQSGIAGGTLPVRVADCCNPRAQPSSAVVRS